MWVSPRTDSQSTLQVGRKSYLVDFYRFSTVKEGMTNSIALSICNLPKDAVAFPRHFVVCSAWTVYRCMHRCRALRSQVFVSYRYVSVFFINLLAQLCHDELARHQRQRSQLLAGVRNICASTAGCRLRLQLLQLHRRATASYS